MTTSTAFEGAKTARVNGTTLAYREQGEGAPVVFVHGTVSDLRVWEQQLPELGRSYRAVTYSRRYARPNEDIGPGVDDQMLPHVEDLAAFLREIGAAPAHLVGHSWGAFISLLTAIRHPRLVRTLVLEEPPVIPLFMKTTPPSVTELLRLFATRPRTGVALIRFVAGTIAPATKALERGNDEEALQIFTAGVLGAEAIERLPEGSEQIARDNVSSLRAQLTGAGFPPLADEDVRGIGAPTLLLTGEHSPPGILRLTDRLEELLPNVERVEIPDASHAMQQENPRATNQAILEFLGRLGGGPRSAPQA
jgi:pimeloyl-ACP methyl ester carboxylesterase